MVLVSTLEASIMKNKAHRLAYPKRLLQDEEEEPEPDLERGGGAETPSIDRREWNFETSNRSDIDWRDEPL